MGRFHEIFISLEIESLINVHIERDGHVDLQSLYSKFPQKNYQINFSLFITFRQTYKALNLKA